MIIRYILLAIVFVQILFAELIPFNEELYKELYKLYGPDGLKRVVYVKYELESINQKTQFIYAKLSRVNKLLNRVKYKKDKEHWREEYNSTFLELIASGAGDSYDFASAKYAILVKMGLKRNKFRFYTTNVKGINKLKYDTENYYVLGYLSKDDTKVLILDCYTDKLIFRKTKELKNFKKVDISPQIFNEMESQIYSLIYKK
jgi:predicted transglutaminase-like cysteine proteinase